MSGCRDLDQYLDGTLERTLHEAFVQHLASCAACDGTVRHWRAAEKALVAWGHGLPTPSASAAGARVLEQRARVREAPSRLGPWAWATAVVAALGCLGAFWWWTRRADPAGPARGDRRSVGERPGSSGDDSAHRPVARRTYAAHQAPVAVRWGRVQLVLDQGATGWVDPDQTAEVQMGLTGGQVAVAVDPGQPGPPVRLAAGPFEVRVVGTRFMVRWQQEALLVSVEAGTVRVTASDHSSHLVRGGQSLRWPAREEAVLAPLGEPERARLVRLLPVGAAAVLPPAALLPPPLPPAARRPPPSSDPPGREQGRVLLLAGRLPEAETVLRGVLGREADDAEAWSLLADTLRKAGRHAEAVTAYARATSLAGPQANRARFLSATLLQDRLGRPAEAATLLRAYLSATSAETSLQAEALGRLGRAELAQGRRGEAERILRRLVRDHGGTAAAVQARQLLLGLERGQGGER
jgi:ferric-dicitrate binding protein FerR (iron transport regulator)